MSKEKYGYNAEQALGMLFWHKHDLDRAIQVRITISLKFSTVLRRKGIIK